MPVSRSRRFATTAANLELENASLDGTFARGEAANLADGAWKIRARTMRIWAESLDGNNKRARVEDKNTPLVESAYRSRDLGTYSYRFVR